MEPSPCDSADMVSVMALNNSHYEYAIASQADGLNVICEKMTFNNVKISWIWAEKYFFTFIENHDQLKYCNHL